MTMTSPESQQQQPWEADLEQARELVRRAAAVQPGSASDRAAELGDRLVLGIARHWLLLFNLAISLYLGLPFLAPLLMNAGATAPANLIYTVYRPACHQLPERSYFLFGERIVYTLEDLDAAGVLPGLDILSRRHYAGDGLHGWKVAICERDVAIYGALLLAGLAFTWLRSRIPKLSFKGYILLLLPIAIDGLSQLVGLRTSNWWLRTLTGGLFGLATVWLAYPYVEEAMQDVRRGIERKLALKQRADELLAQTGQMQRPEV